MLKRKEAYHEENRDAKLDKMKTYYEENREAVLKRKEAYHKSAEYKTLRQTKGASHYIGLYRKETRYGPQFSCVVCENHHFLENMVNVSNVQELHGEEAKEFFSDTAHIRDANYPAMFVQLDRQWICCTCRNCILAGDLPANAAKNGLACTWRDPRVALLQCLTPSELEAIAVTSMFVSVDGLRDNVMSLNPYASKSILVPRSAPRLSCWKKLADHGSGETMEWPHHGQPAEQRVIRREVVENVFNTLAMVHPLYESQENKSRALAAVLQVVDTVGRDGEGEEEDPEAGEESDHFVAWGPAVDVIYSMLLPNAMSMPAGMVGGVADVASQTDLVTRLGGAIFDIDDAAGVSSAGREKRISVATWCLQRLRHVNRNSLTNRPRLLFALLLQKTYQQLATQDQSHKLKGSDAYYNEIEDKLKTVEEWYHRPVFFCTRTVNIHNPIHLATWTSHTSAVDGEHTQVWHRSDEQALLTLQPGENEPDDAGTYFTHTWSSESDGSTPTKPGGESSSTAASCPYTHGGSGGCIRTPIEERRDR